MYIKKLYNNNYCMYVGTLPNYKNIPSKKPYLFIYLFMGVFDQVYCVKALKSINVYI